MCIEIAFSVNLREEPAVDGDSITPGEFAGFSLLGWDDHVMCGPGKAPRGSTEILRQRIKFGKWHRLLQDTPSLVGGRHFTQIPDRSFKVDMTRFMQERLRPISLLPVGQERRDEQEESESAASRGRFSILGCVAMPT